MPVGLDAMKLYALFPGGRLDVLMPDRLKETGRYVPLRVLLPNETGSSPHRSILVRSRLLGRHLTHVVDTGSLRIVSTTVTGTSDGARMEMAFLQALLSTTGNPLLDAEASLQACPTSVQVDLPRFSDMDLVVTSDQNAFVPGKEDARAHHSSWDGGHRMTIVIDPEAIDPNSQAAAIILAEAREIAGAMSLGNWTDIDSYGSFSQLVASLRPELEHDEPLGAW
jgi:hypothetical protein